MNIEKRNTSTENFGNKPENINSNIDSFYKNFIETYKLSHDTIVQLTSFTSQKERISLQESLSNLDIKKSDKEKISQLSEGDLQQLLGELKELKQQRLSLLNEISESYSSKEITKISNTSTLESTFGKKSIEIAQNPQKPHEHIHGGAMGLANTGINTVKVITDIGKGIINTPRDLYLLGTGKAQLPEYNV
ncbi:hypothetical protein A9Q91_01740 [Candidatus Gracilibacteria bacterium 28_42_T64]|nr:hypothetical protein A9Q91_01740 [Candidatus Gracilibacteria bacterium 28_42_T64]